MGERAETSRGGNFDVNYRATLFATLDVSVNQLFFYTRLQHALVLVVPTIITPGPSSGGYQFTNANGPVVSRSLETNVRVGYEQVQRCVGYNLVDTRRCYAGEDYDSPVP